MTMAWLPFRRSGGDGAAPAGRTGDLFPQARLAGPMPWVIAIMVALTVIASAAGLALSRIADSAAEGLAGGVTVQIVEANAPERDRQAAAATRALMQAPGVIEARLVTQEEIGQLIEPWLGGAPDSAEAIPVPALIDVRLRDPIDGETLGGLRRMVRQVAPSARVDAQATWLGPVFDTIDSLRWLALALVALLAFTSSCAVLLAVRNALGANRTTIDIVHLLGASDAQIAHIFQRRVGLDAAGGALPGLVLGLGVILLLGRQFAGLGSGLMGGAIFGPLEWIALALAPLGMIVLAMLTARIVVLRALRGML